MRLQALGPDKGSCPLTVKKRNTKVVVHATEYNCSPSISESTHCLINRHIEWPCHIQWVDLQEGGIAWLNDSQTELRCQTSPRCAECSRERLAHLFYKTNRERCSAADTGPAVAWVRGWKHRVNGHGHIAIAHNGQRRKAAIMREEVGTTAEDVAILSDVRINGCRSIHHRRQPQPYVSRKLWRTERSHGQAASVVPDTILLPLPAFFSP